MLVLSQKYLNFFYSPSRCNLAARWFKFLATFLYQFRLRRNDIEDTTLPYPNAKLIVGIRHCRILISGNINFDATGMDLNTQNYLPWVGQGGAEIDRSSHPAA